MANDTVDEEDAKRRSKRSSTTDEENLDDLQRAQLPVDIFLLVFSYLSVKDLCRLQRTSRFWNTLCTNSHTWKKLVEETGWDYKHCTIIVDSSTWKEIYKSFWRERKCIRCASLYRECNNNDYACFYHRGTRALYDDYNSGPSGVYWTCCEERDKNAQGCTIGGRHTEEYLHSAAKR